MRDLLPTIQPIATRLAASISSQIPSEGTKEINMLPWMSRGALEYVCQATLGYSFNALDADHHNDFAEAVRHLACVTAFIAAYSRIVWLTKFSFPSQPRRIEAHIPPPPSPSNSQKLFPLLAQQTGRLAPHKTPQRTPSSIRGNGID